MAEEQLNSASDQEAPPALKGEKVAVFYVQHSRSSSSSSRCHSGEEKEVEAGRPPKRRRCACLCKVSGLFYLVGCVLVSALYVAVYGQSQQYFAASTEEVWVPGKVLLPLLTSLVPRPFRMVWERDYLLTGTRFIWSPPPTHIYTHARTHSQPRSHRLPPPPYSLTPPIQSGLRSGGPSMTAHSPTGLPSPATLIPSSRLRKAPWEPRRGCGSSRPPCCSLQGVLAVTQEQ